MSYIFVTIEGSPKAGKSTLAKAIRDIYTANPDVYPGTLTIVDVSDAETKVISNDPGTHDVMTKLEDIPGARTRRTE